MAQGFRVIASKVASLARRVTGQHVEPPVPEPPVVETSAAIGYCDGVDGADIRGWAWCPDVPEERVTIEQWVDGRLADVTIANLERSDLVAAKVGDGRYGWRMPLALDPAKSEPQAIELRVKGGATVKGGVFSHTYVSPTAGEAKAAASDVIGVYDGIKGSMLHGWARNLLKPDEAVEVELWVDGAYVCGATANEFRPDLRAQNQGHGRYAWRLPMQLDPERQTPMQVEIRIKDGAPVSNGVFELKYDLSLDDPANAAFVPFVTSVLRPKENPLTPRDTRSARPATFLIYCPEQRAAGEFWAGEYDDYSAAAAAFAEVLRGLGTTLEVSSAQEAEEASAALIAKNENCILLSFAPPRLAPLEVRCPVIPAFAWGFPTLPTGRWDGDARSDWRYVLRQTGRAIVFSNACAEAVRAGMGADYPVAVIPPPVHDRRPKWPLVAGEKRRISFKGAVLDSRTLVLDPNAAEPPLPLWQGDQAGKRVLELDGAVVFTAPLDIFDGRSNWRDVVSAFVFANKDRPDAVLVLQLSEPAGNWWPELFKWLCRLPAFSCRVIAMRGAMDEGDRRALIAATDWVVNAAKAEGFSAMRQALMSAGRPAVAPLHTATLDYVRTAGALIVACEEEAWTWPDDKEKEGFSWTQHPDDVGPTTRARISWTSLNAQLGKAYEISKTDAPRYEALSAGAFGGVREWCGDAIVGARLDAFLGLNQQRSQAPPPRSALLAEPL